MNAMQKAQGSNQLPAQTIVNPKGPNVSAISLRSKKVTEPEHPIIVEVGKKYVSSIPFPQRVLENKKIDEEEHSVFQIELLSEVVDEAYSDLFSADFPTLSGFDDIYSCDDCTNTNLCVVCSEINVALQGDSVNEVVYVAKALDILTAPNIPFTEQPPSLEPKPLPKDLYYSSKLQLKQEHKKGIRWTLDDTRDISPSICMHRISLKGETKVVRQPHNPLILDVVKKEITFTCPFNTFTYQRYFFDPGIQGKYTNQNFKVNGHYPKLLHENPSLEEETTEELSLGKAAYAIIFPP
jgi:hypothetical protein